MLLGNYRGQLKIGGSHFSDGDAKLDSVMVRYIYRLLKTRSQGTTKDLHSFGKTQCHQGSKCLRGC